MVRQVLLVALSVFLLPLFAFGEQEATCSDPSSAISAVSQPAVDEPAAEEPGAQNLESLLPPEPQEAVCIFICEWFGFTTSTKWGIGADCTASRNDLVSQVGAEATSIGPGLCAGAGAISYCGYNLVITGACHWDSSHWAYVTDGHGNIKCKDYC